MINLETGQSKCFGFIRFSTLQEAQAAIHGLNGHQIGSKRLLVKYAESRERSEPVSSAIYVKRLPLTIDVNGVAQLFSAFGKIMDITPHSFDSVDPQFWRCIIRYTTVNAAAAAIKNMNNQIVASGSRPIHVRYADESRMSGGSFAGHGGAMPVPEEWTGEPDPRRLLPSFLFD
jgi:polyadenylate-binding protein